MGTMYKYRRKKLFVIILCLTAPCLFLFFLLDGSEKQLAQQEGGLQENLNELDTPLSLQQKLTPLKISTKTDNELDKPQSLQQKSTTPKIFVRTGDQQEFPFRVVHIDFKGAPPRMSYLEKLLPMLADEGCNALLLEYEDMFPFDGSLVNISAKNAYTKQEIRKLLSWTHDLNMEVIPLVQTFGHLEYVLKLPEFRGLRELDPFPQEVCPSNQGTLTLIEQMVSQVLALHPFSKYLHIGCDEVFHLAACSRCSAKSSDDVYAAHVIQVATLVKKKYPNVVPIIWDDMIRKWNPKYLSTSGLHHHVEPMVWAYSHDVSRLIQHYTWHWYRSTFKRIWVAGAFKGATHPTSVLPDIEAHFYNQKSWLRYTSKRDAHIAGFVLTGWSRYDHFSVLCELLPVSIPSLLLSLSVISFPKWSTEDIFLYWMRNLHCPSKPSRDIFSNPKILSSCNFDGVDLYTKMLQYSDLKLKIDLLKKTLTETKGWMTKYNLDHNFTNPYRLIEDYTHLSIRNFQEILKTFTDEVKAILLIYFDSYTTDEWIEQKLKPLADRLNRLNVIIERLLKAEVWPRRPIQ